MEGHGRNFYWEKTQNTALGQWRQIQFEAHMTAEGVHNILTVPKTATKWSCGTHE